MDRGSLRGPGRPSFGETDRPAADRFDRACRKFVLDSGHTQPLWRQLAEQLENVIRRGALQTGARIPSEDAMAQRFGVSRSVVRSALHALAYRGLVVKLPRRGIFVGEVRQETAFITTNLAAYDDLVARGHKVTTADFSLYRCPANARERERLELDESDTVVRICRMFCMDGQPISYAHIAFHGAKVPGMEDANLKDRPILRHVAQRYNRTLVRAERWFKATMPPTEVAARMQVTTRTPMIWVESVAYEADNSPLEYYEAYYNSELALIHLSVIG